MYDFLRLQNVKATRAGFTLIEMMVAVALFSVVMVISVGVLISVVNASRRAEAVQAVIDNLDFALDDMSRTIRTATTYHCMTDSSLNTIGIPNDCTDTPGSEIAVEPYGGDPSKTDQVLYEFASKIACGSENFVGGCIRKSTDGGANFNTITSPTIDIKKLSFYVIGSCPKSNNLRCTTDSLQPRVTMLLQGQITYQSSVIELKLETNMTQRLYDL